MKVKIIEAQGLPHTLTQADGETFRILARQAIVIDESLVSESLLEGQRRGYFLIVPVAEETEKSVKSEETKNSKGGKK